MDKKLIGEVFNKYKTDKGPWRHGYNQCYSDVFKNFTPSSLLEIGVFEGRSLAAWRELFPTTIIHGIDDFSRNVELIEEVRDMHIMRGDSRRKSFVDTIETVYDVIIDDGDHRPDSQWETFLNFQHLWKSHYVIEDVINEDKEKILRRRLTMNAEKYGIKKVTSYRSAFKGVVQINGEQVLSSFFAMVVQR